MLDRVTITGADDSVDVDELIALSDEYPFVEWGILFSRSAHLAGGATRFPSALWLDTLRHAAGGTKLKLAAHLCGGFMRDTLQGRATWWDTFGHLNLNFQRIQLNFHAEKQPRDVGPFLREIAPAARFIFQCDGVNDVWVKELVADGYGVPLFDTSGGAGVLPADGWPLAWPGVYCGYAGGLGPVNVIEQLNTIQTRVSMRYWIDMERRVRTPDDRSLHMGLVRRVLEQTARRVV